MTDPRYVYRCSLLDVIDGDTLDLRIELGFHITHRARIRLAGVNTPETRSPYQTERDAALEASQHVASWCAVRAEQLLVKTMKDGRDKFGRLLATLIDQATGETLQDSLLAAGLAVPYDGQTKRKAWGAAHATLPAGDPTHAQGEIRQDGTRAGEGSGQERPDGSAT